MKPVPSLVATTYVALVSVSLVGLAVTDRHHGPAPQAQLAKTTGAGKAYAWRRLAWLDEDGKIAPGAYQRALDQRRSNVEAWGETARDDGGSVPWVSRGPDNVGGRTRSLLIHPTNPQIMLAGSVSGGIWRTTNGGTTWQSVSDWLPSLAIGCMAFDPTNPDVVYAGTGEGFFNGDAIGGTGLLKSKDGGLTWSLLPGTSGWNTVCRIAVHPTNPNILLVGTRYGGIQRSTNGGNTWSNPLWAQGCFDVRFDPTNGNKAVADLIDYDWGTGNWFHRAVYSTNGGVSWQVASGLGQVWNFDSRIELAYSRSNPSIVYASCAKDGGKVWRSTDGGQSYVQRTTSGSSGASWYACPIWVDPTNPNVLLVGGYDIYRSTDGGATLNQISSGYILTQQPHPDQHLFVSDPGFNGTTNKKVWACTDGSMYVTNDIYAASSSSGWSRRDLTYRTTQYYGAQGDGPTGLIIGGTQDNGTLRLTNSQGNTANLPFGGDGGWCAIDPTNTNYTYGEYVNLMIHRSTNGGSSAGYIYNGIADAGNAANFIAPFVLDLNNTNRMLAGGRSLWRSNNVKAASPTWAAIRSAGTDNISAIAIAPGNSNIVWVGQNDGRVSRSTNATATSPSWVDVDNNGTANPFPNRYVTRIVVDPANSNVVYVALGGYDPDNLWRTVDGGSTWMDVTGALPKGIPNAPIRGFAVHPTNSQRLYAGTEIGLFTSADGGATWSTNDFGPANVSIDEATFMHNSSTLLLATHGRGIWTASLPNPAGIVSGTIQLGSLSVSPAGRTVSIEIFDAGGTALRASKTVTLDAQGRYSFDPDIASGPYDVCAKASHWLRKKLRVNLLGSGTSVPTTTLANGDVDGDNAVTVFDYNLLSAAFDSAPGDADWNPEADLDGDGSVTVFDYNVMTANFDLVGD